MDLEDLQSSVAAWSRKNFPAQEIDHPLLGMVEELGELAHAVLKSKQGIRTLENHTAAARDAIGDLAIYMLDYCNRRGWSLAEILTETWSIVSRRDWQKNPEKGVVDHA